MMASISPDQAFRSIFRTMWNLNPTKAFDFIFYQSEGFLSSTNHSLLGEYLNFLLRIEIGKLNFYNKIDFKHLIGEILESGILDKLYSRNHFETGLRKKEKELKEIKK